MTLLALGGAVAGMLLLLGLNFPIATAIGIPATIVFIAFLDIDPAFIPQFMYSSLNSFPSVAVPFFVLASHLLVKGGLAKDLIELSNLIVGRFYCGLAISTTLASVFFSAISGSSVATVLAVGSISIKGMTDNGYDSKFATGLVACAGTLGILIPPSITLILYGVIASVSIAELFAAGLLPGALLGVLLMIASNVIARRKRIPKVTGTGNRAHSTRVLKNSVTALAAPVAVLGGIYFGVWTPTEASAAAVFIALFVGTVVRRTLSLKDVIDSCLETAAMVGLLTFIFGFSQVFAFLVAFSGIPTLLVDFVIQEGLSQWTFFAIVTAVALVAGQFMPAISILVLLAPVFVPVAKILGIDLVHFGILFTLLLEISFVTPPVGFNVNVAAGIANMRLVEVFQGAAPFGVVLFIGFLVVVAFPKISLFLPQILF